MAQDGKNATQKDRPNKYIYTYIYIYGVYDLYTYISLHMYIYSVYVVYCTTTMCMVQTSAYRSFDEHDAFGDMMYIIYIYIYECLVKYIDIFKLL